LIVWKRFQQFGICRNLRSRASEFHLCDHLPRRQAETKVLVRVPGKIEGS
jgi:hypothetical protein